MFILASQNLIAIFNFAMRINMIPGFDSSLNYNFNHFMYADDLIIVTQASQKSAHNIKLCFSIYEKLTSKRANNNKSEIYFPVHFNNRINKSICCVLNFKDGFYSFTYLGVSIFHKKLAISHFSLMVDKIKKKGFELESF